MFFRHQGRIKDQTNICAIKGVIHKGPLPNRTTKAQIGLDQRGQRTRSSRALKRVFGNEVHILITRRPRLWAQPLRRKMAVMQQLLSNYQSNISQRSRS